MKTALHTFPTDDETLERLEEACRTAIEVTPTGQYLRVGGASTLQDLLIEMSGPADQRNIPLGVCYSANDVILALIAHIKELDRG